MPAKRVYWRPPRETARDPAAALKLSWIINGLLLFAFFGLMSFALVLPDWIEVKGVVYELKISPFGEELKRGWGIQKGRVASIAGTLKPNQANTTDDEEILSYFSQYPRGLGDPVALLDSLRRSTVVCGALLLFGIACLLFGWIGEGFNAYHARTESRMIVIFLYSAGGVFLVLAISVYWWSASNMSQMPFTTSGTCIGKGIWIAITACCTGPLMPVVCCMITSGDEINEAELANEVTSLEKENVEMDRRREARDEARILRDQGGGYGSFPQGQPMQPVMMAGVQQQPMMMYGQRPPIVMAGGGQMQLGVQQQPMMMYGQEPAMVYGGQVGNAQMQQGNF